MTPNDTSITFAMFHPIFLVSWPLKDLGEGNEGPERAQAQEEILAYTIENEAEMKTLPQNCQVYILLHSEKQLTDRTTSRQGILLNDIIEVYGIQSNMSVVKSVYEDDMIMSRNLEALTVELLRFAPRRSNFLSARIYVLAQV